MRAAQRQLPMLRIRTCSDVPAQGKWRAVRVGEACRGGSGAIAEYIPERYGAGRLAPPIGSPLRPRFLQWLHFAESTAFPPLGIVVWLTLYRPDAAEHPTLIAD